MTSIDWPLLPISRRRLITSASVLAADAIGAGSRTFWQRQPAVAAAQESSLDQYPGIGEPPLLVTAGDLQSLLDNERSSPVVLDVSPILTYGQEHIPTAIHAWWQDTIDPEYQVYGAVLTQGEDQLFRRRVLAEYGVTAGDRVIVYDDQQGRHAARVVWFLRFLGVSGASMLDGGLAAWREVGGRTTGELANPRGVSDPVVDPQEGFYLVTTQLLDRLTDRGTVIVDIRTAGEANDDLGLGVPLGRIPGARSFPWTEALDDRTGRLKSPPDLATAIERLQIDSGQEVVVYGRYGVEAALSWLVFKLNGFARVSVYDRGWIEWATTPGLPIDPL